MNAARRRFFLAEAISRITTTVPGVDERSDVYRAIYPILRQFDSDAVLDFRHQDPAYDRVLAEFEPWFIDVNGREP